MIEMQTPTLPDLQPAVDALFARITAGRTRATGTAVKSGLTGRVTDSTPEEFAIVEAVMGGRWSKQMLDIWSRDDLHVAGASEADWALAREIAYHAIQAGYSGEQLALTVERIMRAGPYRAKWDEPRGNVSWLAQDVANAIQTTQERLKKYRERYPDFPLDELGDQAETPADETIEQELARLRRELANARTLIAQQQTIIRAERDETAALKTRLGEILAVLRNEHLSPTSRVVAVVLGETVEQLRSHEHDGGEIMRADLARKAGVSESTITREMKQLCHDLQKPARNPEAPVWKNTVPEWREIDGEQRPTSRTSIGFNTDAPILAAFAAYRPPEVRKHGGARMKGCPDHPTADLIIRSTTHCAECDRQLGEPTETLRKQVDTVGEQTDPPVNDGYSGEQVAPVGGHDGEKQCERAALTLPIPFPEARTRRLEDQDARVAHPPRPQPWRCHCGSYERQPRSGGGWRCDGCNAVCLPAVAGGAE